MTATTNVWDTSEDARCFFCQGQGPCFVVVDREPMCGPCEVKYRAYKRVEDVATVLAFVAPRCDVCRAIALREATITIGRFKTTGNYCDGCGFGSWGQVERDHWKRSTGETLPSVDDDPRVSWRRLEHADAVRRLQAWVAAESVVTPSNLCVCGHLLDVHNRWVAAVGHFACTACACNAYTTPKLAAQKVAG